MVRAGAMGGGSMAEVEEMRGKENLPKDTVFEKNIVIASGTMYPS